MAESYCGKNCAQCAEKDMLDCPGCRVGPGRFVGTECEAARCCISKGQSRCAECEFCNDCYTLERKDSFLQHRLATVEKDKSRTEMLTKGAPILGRWLCVALWLIIPSMLGSILSNDAIFDRESIFFAFGQMLSLICAPVYSLVLLRLGSVEKRYRSAAFCVLAGALISAATNYMFSGKEVPLWAMTISIPTTVLSFVGEYFEFMAHSAVLTNVNDRLSAKWETLWKWYIGSSAAYYGGVLLAFVIPALGIMLINAGDIGTVLTRVLKLVYLYQTVKCFRYYRTQYAGV